MKNVSFTIAELLEFNITKDMETFTYFRTPGTILNDHIRIKEMQLADVTTTGYDYPCTMVFGEIELKAQRAARELEPCILA